MKTLILGTFSLPFESHLQLSQNYEEEQASRLTRHSDGSARKQTAWNGKIKTTITGSGWVPPCFEMLDYESTMELSCIAAKAVAGATNTITIPSARRADAGFEPFGVAVIDGESIETPIVSIDGSHLATLTAVTGADYYIVYYYPKITVFADRLQQQSDIINQTTTWTLNAREA